MRASPQVPYLDYKPRYDGGGFDAFPSRCGIDTDKLQRGDLGAHTIDSIIPFLQEWLFFGLLQEVFEVAHVQFRREDFVAKATAIPGQYRISTANLPKYLWSWTANTVWVRDNFGEFDHQKRRVEEVLKLSNLCLNAVIRLQAAQRGTEPATGPVLLSLAIVGESLDSERDTVFLSQREEFYGTLTWETPEFCRKLLLEAGCCIGEVNALRRDFPSVSSLYYLATWDRSASKADHSQCAETCLARQIDEKTYATKHTGEGCSCHHLPIDMTAIFNIVDQGQIPLILFSNGKVRVQQSPSGNIDEDTRPVPYVAISHVWSDGLGNTKANTLPRCQLEKIQQLVNALYQGVYGHRNEVPFWMDTLCVPLESIYRKKAIRAMSEVYMRAEKVLVLDASLQIIDVRAPIHERMMRVVTAPWATRLWTFQEGVLAEQLHFQFCGGTIRPTALEARSQTEGKSHIALANFLCRNKSAPELPGESTLLRLEIGNDMNTLFRSLRGNFSSPVYLSGVKAMMKILGGHHLRDMSPFPNLHSLQLPSSVGIRTTSKAEDETLCLAGVLGLDVQPLLDCDKADRMKTFVSLLDTIPPDLIFAPGPRLQDAGYGWAATSFLGAIHEPLTQLIQASRLLQPGLLQARGLRVVLPGLRVRKSVLPESDVVFAFDGYSRMKLQLTPGGRWSTYNGSDGLMVMMSQYTERGAVVLLEERLEGTWYVKFQELLTVEVYESVFEPSVSAEEPDDDTVWCVN
ncbi:hypothetical protein BO85DRAFT_500478 [Aspergillus piperis CBS 112811]|uniref:Heterokaryon incompatibility domain-containing protein n=1 Tax=Aspergillus piperis CBS 112811 TaxID=1448313 RepID=A0A8G1VJP5_9EURO|nr:hypothetical protein BO85DRAFT_500478 [Aspergillus piperis CBS 112811]RAH54487.1 hypothetical protein BO85DRAFT_500478 [Aspergillus piperis CBS 112811]